MRGLLVFLLQLVVGVYVGFDKPRVSWQKSETGSSVAVPIFKDYMEKILKYISPKLHLGFASGVSFVKIDPITGLPTTE